MMVSTKKYGLCYVGQTVEGRKNGRRWQATVAPSGKLIGRVWL